MTPLLPLLLLVILVGRASSEGTSCYTKNTTPYLMLGSHTAYEFVYGRPTTQQTSVPYCEAKQIWILSRHGTRYAGADEYEELNSLRNMRDQIIRNHEINHEGDLCNEDLENLKSWTLKFTPDMDNVLTPQGEDDMRLMAQRFKNRYPALFNEGYKQESYEFRYTNTQRTQASAEKFAEGLFGTSEGVYFPAPLENDTLLKPYGNCEAWKTTVDDNPASSAEKVLFEQGPVMDAVVANVSKRLGFRYKLKYDNISSMYDMCRYDKAWNVAAISPWCAAFSESELKVLEYDDDLKYYYKSGYGYDINVELGCPPVKDFMDRFSKLETNITSNNPKGIFYFSHDSMLHMVQSRMGIAKDPEPLTHSSYDVAKKRKWRVSKIGSFATNIAAVFFKCTQGEENRVMFYISENLLDIEGCQVGLCSWSAVKQKFSEIAQTCNLDFCDLSRNQARKVQHMPWLLVITFLFIKSFLKDLYF